MHVKHVSNRRSFWVINISEYRQAHPCLFDSIHYAYKVSHFLLSKLFYWGCICSFLADSDGVQNYLCISFSDKVRSPGEPQDKICRPDGWSDQLFLDCEMLAYKMALAYLNPGILLLFEHSAAIIQELFLFIGGSCHAMVCKGLFELLAITAQWLSWKCWRSHWN